MSVGKRIKRALFLPAAAAFALLSAPAGAVELSPEGGLAPSGWFINHTDFQTSAHGFQGCTGCHQEQEKGIMPRARTPHPDPRAPDYLRKSARTEFDYRYCARCHSTAYERYGRGKHQEEMKKQEGEPPGPDGFPSPTCAHCHDPHSVVPHQDRRSSARVQVEVCGSCHRAEKASYLENYHGRTAVHLGYEKSALCSDCHGAHSVVSLKEKEAALKACRRCHPGAPPGLAEMVIHAGPEALKAEDGPKKERVAVIRALGVIMAVIALVAVLGFYTHGFLWLLRELKEKIRRRG